MNCILELTSYELLDSGAKSTAIFIPLVDSPLKLGEEGSMGIDWIGHDLIIANIKAKTCIRLVAMPKWARDRIKKLDNGVCLLELDDMNDLKKCHIKFNKSFKVGG